MVLQHWNMSISVLSALKFLFSMRIGDGLSAIDETAVKFYGYSGSCYECKKGSYGAGFSYTVGILDNFINKAKDVGVSITILPEDTNWIEL